MTSAGGRSGRVLVVGGGVTGLRVADRLREAGRTVTVAEAAPSVGGLASGWTVETEAGDVTWDRFYHVVLESDEDVRAYAARLGIAVNFSSVGATLLANGRVSPMSSALDLLRLPALRPIDRLRVGLAVLLGGLLPITARTDRTTSARWLRRASGRRAYADLWQPLLRAKLGRESERASAVFIRSTFTRLLRARLSGGAGDRFGWLDGGYQAFLSALVRHLDDAGVDVRTGTRVERMERTGDEWTVQFATDGSTTAESFDQVVITLAGPLAHDLVSRATVGQVPPEWESMAQIPYLGCVCVFAVLRRQLTPSYLTYVTDETPYTALVEMTNLVPREQTGGLSVLYLPLYARSDDPVLREEPGLVASRFMKDLAHRYPGFSSADVVATRTARARYVMPVPVPGRRSNPVRPDAGVRGLFVASSVQLTDGTLNVQSSLEVADAAVRAIIAADELGGDS